MLKTLKVEVLGMHCSSCASKIETAITKVSGVKSVAVNAVNNKALIEMEETTDVQKIVQTLKAIGYDIKL